MKTCSRLLVAGLIAIGVAGGVAQVVNAHEGEGILTVESAVPDDGGLTIHYRVRLVWQNDSHPAKDATITIVAVGVDGQASTPVALTPVDDDGRYEADVTFATPGEWTARITSVTPAATLEEGRVVRLPSTTTTAPSSNTSTTELATTTAEPATPTSTVSGTAEEAGHTGTGTVVFFVVLIVLCLVVGIAVARGLSRRTDNV